MKPEVTNFADMKEMCKRVNLLEPTEKIKIVAITLEKMIAAFGKAVEDLNQREIELPEDVEKMYLSVFADELEGGEDDPAPEGETSKEAGEEAGEEKPEEEPEEEPEAEKKPPATKPAAKKAAPKNKATRKAGSKEKKKKFKAWLTEKLKENDYTRKELALQGVKEFSKDYAEATVITMITDAKNPKYCVLDFLMVEDPETKICKLSKTKVERKS